MNPEIQAQGPVYLVLALCSWPLRKSPEFKKTIFKIPRAIIGHLAALQRASFLFSFSPPETLLLSEDDQMLGK